MSFYKENDDGTVTILESGLYELSSDKGIVLVKSKDEQITERWTDLMFGDLEE